MVPHPNGTVLILLGTLDLYVFGSTGTAVPLPAGMPFISTGISVQTDVIAVNTNWDHGPTYERHGVNTAWLSRPDRLWRQWDRGPTGGRYAIYSLRDLSPEGCHCCQRQAGTMVSLPLGNRLLPFRHKHYSVWSGWDHGPNPARHAIYTAYR